MQAVGAAFLRLVARREFDALGLPAKLALGFFAGTGPWHVAMLALGYLNLYSFTVAAIVTLPVVVAAYGNFAHAVREIRAAAGSGRLRRNLGAGTSALVGWTIVTFAGVAFVLLLLIKGLYPGGGHDYFTHYFYYYVAVLERGGLWPNDVWYHYYYSKGAGLYFLAMLLTDPLAPQLVAFCFIATAALALFLLLRRIAPHSLWPLAGVVLFLSLYIVTPALAIWFRNNGGWGDFEKLHEPNAALVIAVLWMTVCALDRSRSPRLWWTGAASAIVAAVIINITIAVFFAAVFGLLALWRLLFRDFRRFFAAAGLGLVAASMLVLTLALNYFTSGLGNDQDIRVFWKFADIERLYEWGALPIVVILHHGVTGMADNQLSFGLQLLRVLIEAMRLEMLLPLVVGGMIFAGLAARWLFQTRTLVVPFSVLAAALVIFAGLAFSVGRTQPISFYRYSSFALPITISAGILLWGFAGRRRRDVANRLARSDGMVLVCLVATLMSAVYPDLTMKHLRHALRFAIGIYSIDDAYGAQYGPPPRQQWTAIHEGAREAYNIVGPKTPIWSLHVHLYCMLPDCLMESFRSFIMTPRWDRVMFGTPVEARDVLKAANVNYFLFSTAHPLTDPLPLSALFRPDDIGKYLGIRWTDGTTTLLTWPGPDTTPIDDAWRESYRKAVADSATVKSFPYDQMQAIFLRLHATPRPWHSFPLPW